MKKILSFLVLISFGCNTGNLTVIADLPSSLKEVSAIEVIPNSNLFWVIEDSGNKNVLYGLDDKGRIKKELKVTNADNTDWEDLTSDEAGNIYIGDFGNNNNKRKEFVILKVEQPEKADKTIAVKEIKFRLPKNTKSLDFEAFFLLNDHFYIFSKDDKKGKLFKVPNTIGNHEAIFISDFNLKGKDNAITSADYDNGTLVLLNHDKVWEISKFNNDTFFNGTIEVFEFNHKSQKEGVCFKGPNSLIITDEQKNSTGGNMYSFILN